MPAAPKRHAGPIACAQQTRLAPRVPKRAKRERGPKASRPRRPSAARGDAQRRITVEDFNARLRRSRRRGRFGWIEALNLLETLKGQVVPAGPDVVSYNTIMTDCGGRGRWTQVLGLLEAIGADGLEPDLISLSASTGACQKASFWKTALRLLADLSRTVQADIVVWNPVLTAAAAGGEPAKVQELLASVREEGLLPTIMTYGGAVPRKGSEWPCAVAYLRKARSAQLQVSTPMQNAVLYAACQADRWRFAQHLVHHAAKDGMGPNTVGFNTLLSGHSQDVWVEAAATFAAAAKLQVQPSILDFSINQQRSFALA
eukprot:s1792_g9.t1